MQRSHKLAGLLVGMLFAILLSACVEQLGDGAAAPTTSEVVNNDSTTQSTQAETDVSVLGAQAAAPQVEIFVQPGQSGSGLAADDALDSFITALEQVKPGMTIVLRGGEYTESMAGNIHYSVSTSGTPDAWVTIKAFPGETPTIRATSGSGIEVHADYVAIDGLTIVGPGDARTSNYGYGVGIGGHHIKVWNSTISAMPGGGIGAGHSSHLWIEGNVIHNNSNWAPEQTSGISTWLATEGGDDLFPGGYADIIMGNVVYDNEVLVLNNGGQITDGNGIILDSSNINGYMGPTLVANNVVNNNGGAGIVVLNSNNVDIAHNTFADNAQTEGIVGGGGEIAVTYDSLAVRATNNIVSPREGIRAFQYYRATATTENNLVAEVGVSNATFSGADINVASIGFALSGLGVIEQLTPTPSSPAVNAANASLLPVTTDYSGTPRPQGGAPDIGALELLQASAAASTPATAAPTTTTTPATTAPAKSAETTTPQSNAVTGTATSAPADTATQSSDSLPSDEQALGEDDKATAQSIASGRNTTQSTQEAVSSDSLPEQLAYAELSDERKTSGFGGASLLTGLAVVGLTVAGAVALRLTRRGRAL